MHEASIAILLHLIHGVLDGSVKLFLVLYYVRRCISIVERWLTDIKGEEEKEMKRG